MKIGLFEASACTDKTQQQVAALFEQLAPGRRQLPLRELLEPGNPLTLAYCEAGGNIVGIALMCTYKVISGHKGWIEDVVVDENWRGQGIGRLLIEKLLEVAREKGLSEVLLFSAGHRQAAIALYTSLGFQHRETGLYGLRMA